MRLIVGLVLVAVAAAGAHPWACYHGNQYRTGRSTAVVGESLNLVTTFAAGGDISGSAVVNDAGQMIFGARDMTVYCLNAGGTPAWTADLSSLGTSIYFSTPALDASGSCYITTSRKLVKITSNGTIDWSWPAHNSLSISHSPVIGNDGKVYFACYSDSLYAVNTDGSLAWAAALGNSVNGSPAVGRDGRILVATTRGTSGWKLWAFNPNGTTAWNFDLAAGSEFSTPAVGPDSVIYVGAGRYLYAVSPAGTQLWRDSLGAVIQCCPAVANESTLYVVAGARLYSVDTDSGIRWRRSIGGSNYCAPAVDAEGTVYVGSANSTSSTFYAIGADSTELWSYPVPDEIWSSPAIGAAGRICFGTMDGTFYIFEGTGAGVVEQAAAPVLSGFRVEPNPARGRARLLGIGPAPFRARVSDASGRVRLAATTDGSIDLAGLEPGVYTVTAAGRTARVVVR